MSARWVRQVALVAALSCGCGPEPVPLAAPNAVGNPGATERLPLEPTLRPDVQRSFSIDYASIPHLVAQELARADADAKVTFASMSSLGEPRVSGDLMVEIEAGELRTFTAEPLLAAGKPPVCVARNAKTPISWEGFSLASWTDAFIDYVRYEGTFDESTCVASAARVARVRAPAVIPGVAYAFRTCVPVCPAPPAPGEGEELLVLITPKARWVGATAPWLKLQTTPHVGMFSRLIAPLRRGGAASLFAHVDRADLVAFSQRRKGKAGNLPELPAASVLSLAFDFSWVEADPLPVAVGFVGAVSGGGGASAQAPINF